MTLKRSSEIFADENRNFLGKDKIGKIFHGGITFYSEIGGVSETGRNASLPHGDGRYTVHTRDIAFAFWSRTS